MSLYGLSVFCLAYLLAVASPGPGVAAVLARSLGHGLRGTPAFIAGFVVGDLVWFTVAVTGLAALAQTAQVAFLGVKYAGVAYLLFLAWRLWTAPPQPLETTAQAPQRGGWRLFLGSLALTLGNPKTMVFFVALLPTVVQLETLDLVGYLEITALMATILPLVLGGYAVAGARARQLFRKPRAVQLMNRGSGVAMAGAAVVIAVRE